MGDPSMRASYIKDNVAALALLGDAAARIEARVPDVIATVAAASKLEWMPLQLDIALTAAVFAESGRDGVRAWSRRALLQSLQGPLLKPILDGAVTLFGLSPPALLKRSPLIWKQIYRDCGLLHIEEPERHVVNVVIAGVPTLISDDVGYLEGTAGAFEAVLELTHVKGHVDVVAVPVGFRVAWSPA
jgi:hypothetical protein